MDINELLISMRFAISLLMLTCVASLIGTLLAQNRSSSQYIDQFGPFWFELFDKFSIWHIYNSWWFLLIMVFLVISTSLCLVRNTPKIWRDMHSFRDYVRASSLRAFTHCYAGETTVDCETTVEAIRQMLAVQGFSVREKYDASGILLAAKKGSMNRLGYISTHAAIVIICVGGLLDSEFPIRLQMWLFDKQSIQENLLIAQVPYSGRLSVKNPSFRSSVLIAEGSRATAAVIMINDGALVQPLPFTIKLRKFIVDYYLTGIPRRFSSEITVTDTDNGKHFDATIEVNEPLSFKGVTVYQSSFADGGSRVSLLAYSLTGQSSANTLINSQVGEEQLLPSMSARLTVTAVHPVNIEDFSSDLLRISPINSSKNMATFTGSAAGKPNDRLRNVGPAIEYRLLNSAGQACEFKNYMQPVLLEGNLVMLAGARAHSKEPYRYLHIPIDDKRTVSEFMQLRATLDDPAARLQAAQQLAVSLQPGDTEHDALERAAAQTLDTFAQTGLQGIAKFLQIHTPPDRLTHAANIVMRLLSASMEELRAIARARSGLPPLAQDDAARIEAEGWLRLAITALSDLKLYPAPVLLTLENFDYVPASIFQVTRAPGKHTVYFGCLVLVVGIFSMFYIRERRVWVWVRTRVEGGSTVQAAMTSQKRALDFHRDFERFTAALRRQLG